MRLLLLLHRYLGVLTGLLMTMWCLTGMVMIYAPYPSVTPAERLAGLTPLNLTHCCRLDALGVRDDAQVQQVSLTMAAGAPVLRVSTDIGGDQVFDLASGQTLGAVSPARAGALATEFIRRRGVTGAAHTPVAVDVDQWTVGLGGGSFWRVDFDGGARVYIEQAGGRVVQETARGERFWNWIGTVPHWLYPTMLRKNPPLWTQVVVWTSLLGCFLTVTGLWIGIVRFRRRESARGEVRWSPYAGLNYWHHITGLVFGLLTLTWVLSGLFSMTPWGLFAGNGTVDGRGLLAGAPVTWAQVRPMLAAVPRLDLPPATVEVSSAPLGGRMFLSARSPGQRLRYDAGGEIFGPDLMQLNALLTTKDGPGLASLIQLRQEDGYYFGPHEPMRLPVWRAILRDGAKTRLYIDPVTGGVLRQVDSDARAFRWWHEGLHRLDFSAGLRRRPFWDVIVLLLLAGVTSVCGLGAWMGWKRIVLDWERWRRR